MASSADAIALSDAGYQPIGRALDLLPRSPRMRMGKVPRKPSASWVGLFREMDGNPAAQAAIRALATKPFWPRLQQLGFTPRDGESPLEHSFARGADRRPWLSRRSDVIAESRRLFAAWQRDPNAIPAAEGDLARRRRPQRRRADVGRVAPDRGGNARVRRALDLLPAARPRQGRRTGAASARSLDDQGAGRDRQRRDHHRGGRESSCDGVRLRPVPSAAGRPADRPFGQFAVRLSDWSRTAATRQSCRSSRPMPRRTSSPRTASGRPCHRAHPVESGQRSAHPARGDRMAEGAPGVGSRLISRSEIRYRRALASLRRCNRPRQLPEANLSRG